MCGIIGYTGPRPAGPILMEGLKRLEYRGYDSAGLAILSPGKRLAVEKRPGKIIELEDALNGRFPDGSCGIAHTRWATHGVPNRVNAHPHLSPAGDIAVVHNGIIESAARQRPLLREMGYEFRSDTDTEVLVHLIDLAYRDCELLEDAVAGALARIEGTYGIAVVEQPGSGQDRGGTQRQSHPSRNRTRRRVFRDFRRGRCRGAHPEGRTAARRRFRGAEQAGLPHLRSGPPRGDTGCADRDLGRGDARQGRLRALHVQGDRRTAVLAARCDAGTPARGGGHVAARRGHDAGPGAP